MDIPGAERLTAIFGQWPSFHDAEVVRLVLDRAGAGGDAAGPSLTFSVRVCRYGPDLAADSTFRRHADTCVTFACAGVQGLELRDFNEQNALWDLELVDLRDRQLEEIAWEVVLSASHGVSARFLCESIAVASVEPWPEPSAGPVPSVDV